MRLGPSLGLSRDGIQGSLPGGLSKLELWMFNAAPKSSFLSALEDPASLFLLEARALEALLAAAQEVFLLFRLRRACGFCWFHLWRLACGLWVGQPCWALFPNSRIPSCTRARSVPGGKLRWSVQTCRARTSGPGSGFFRGREQRPGVQKRPGVPPGKFCLFGKTFSPPEEGKGSH